ncbi:MAG: hypothetical protein ACTSWL_01470 [Promethearchaeota archaeon]
MPLKNLLICDNAGLPFYSRSFDKQIHIDDALLSGLLSAIGTIGKSLFNQNIATIAFGENTGGESSKIVIISRELFSINKQIFFVFFLSGETNLKQLRSLSTMIFMEAKNFFRNTIPEQNVISPRIDKIINQYYNGLKNW